MNTNFTPGPWQPGVDGDGKPGYVYCNNSLGSAVAIAYGHPLNFSVFTREQEKANAALIADAPAMYELLAELSTLIEDGRALTAQRVIDQKVRPLLARHQLEERDHG